MANYTTVDGLLKRIDSDVLGQLCDDVAIGPGADYATEAAMAVITQAISDASGVIDSYVLGHLDMTDSDSIAAVERACANIALYYLHARRFADNESNPKTPAYRQELVWLKGVNKRDLHVATSKPLNTIVSTTSSTDKKFTDTTMRGFAD